MLALEPPHERVNGGLVVCFLCVNHQPDVVGAACGEEEANVLVAAGELGPVRLGRDWETQGTLESCVVMTVCVCVCVCERERC